MTGVTWGSVRCGGESVVTACALLPAMAFRQSLSRVDMPWKHQTNRVCEIMNIVYINKKPQKSRMAKPKGNTLLKWNLRSESAMRMSKTNNVIKSRKCAIMKIIKCNIIAFAKINDNLRLSKYGMRSILAWRGISRMSCSGIDICSQWSSLRPYHAK